MAVLEQIISGLEKGKQEYSRIMERIAGNSTPEETSIHKQELRQESVLSLSDNLAFMERLMTDGYGGKFRTIYIDPPFFTKSKFNAAVSVRGADGTKHRIRHLAFDDRFERSLEYYIENMTVRILMMKDLLARDGTLWIHLDWHSSHYIRLVLDELMGEKNFVNEIIWCYKSGGSGKRHFSRKHDTILVYGKAPGYHIDIPSEKSYNRGFRPYNFKGVREYSDDLGWYTLVNMKDVWNVDMVGRTSSERNGYATQKPLELMRRIIEAGSEEGDLVGDFFCGSGSFLEAAERSGRKWFGCDNEKLAVSLARKRLTNAGADFVSDDIQPAGGEDRLNVTVSESQTLENGGRLLRLKITDFAPEIDTGYIQKNDRQHIENTLREDPVQLLDYVMIDNDYSGRFVCRNLTEDLSGDIIVIAPGAVRLVAVDVFGREYDGGIL
jgi:site-specific DNA-methyltransferase (adenine-specific)